MAQGTFCTEGKDRFFRNSRQKAQGFTDLTTRGEKPPQRSSEMTEQEQQVFKSLQICHDVRYDAMDYYRNHGGTASTTGHFARICQTNRRMHGLTEVKTKVNDGTSLKDLVELEQEEPVNEWERIVHNPTASVANRVEWQESFDKEVKRLFVDFELTDSPNCRLNHLDRMHGWFMQHGAKQIRKSTKGPNFLVVDRKGKLPPGSTKNIPQELSSMSQALSSNFASPYSMPAAARFATPRKR